MDLDSQIKPKEVALLDQSAVVPKSHKDQEFPFNFPFPPYDIQLKLMQVAYDAFEQSRFALLESPTGTGKSLSIICSSLTWLKDHQEKTKKKLEATKSHLTEAIEQLKKDEESSTDWLTIQTKRHDLSKELVDINQKLEKICKLERKSQARQLAKLHNIPMEEFMLTYEANAKADLAKKDQACGKESSIGADSKLIPVDLQETQQSKLPSNLGDLEHVTMLEMDDEDIEKKIKEQEVEHVKPKIYYASRTHSQLSQFIGEIKKTKFAKSSHSDQIGSVKVTSLGSRVNLCINPEVTRLKDSNAINEKCSELQRETNVTKRCPYLKTKQVAVLKEEILSSVKDIEDIVSKGRVLGACPYYATRMAVPESEMVVLPYNNLLHQETRKASSLLLDDSVIIMDESHNILETICSIHSASITGQQLMEAHTLLSRYHNKFLKRLSPKNAELIKTIVQCLTALLRYLNDPKKQIIEFESTKVPGDQATNPQAPVKSSNNAINNQTSGLKKLEAKPEELMSDVTKFTLIASIERFNIFRIVDYFARSQLARKLIGFFRQDSSIDFTLNLLDPKSDDDCKESEMATNDENGRRDSLSTRPPASKRIKTTSKKSAAPQKKQKSLRAEYCTNLNFLRQTNVGLGKQASTATPSYPIYTLVEFFKSLTNLAQDGKISTRYAEGSIGESALKFILLNPSSQFEQMAREARSIALAGGTMQPFSEFIDLLFGPLGVDRKRLVIHSCNHIIDKDQVFVATLSNGPSGRPLELSYKTRSSYEMIDEIGRTILNISNVVPGGMVCFFPSYDYEQFCFQRWTTVGIISTIETKSKQVFREPRQAGHVKTILEEYSRVLEKGKQTNRGAMLLCVVGGKMSEGINFNDDLGRCVVMVGLPYANIKSAELQQKMSYYDKNCIKESSNGDTCNGPGSGAQNLSAGQQYYENLCIKGVNQSIGRAIRHKRDYAAIVLLDRRYATKASIRSGLAGWLRQAVVDYDKFGPMFLNLRQFFSSMSAKPNML